MLKNRYQCPVVNYLPQGCKKQECFGSFPTLVQYDWSSCLNFLKLQSSDLSAVPVRRKIKKRLEPVFDPTLRQLPGLSYSSPLADDECS